MLLQDKTAVVYGAGAIGGAVARVSARVWLAARTRGRLDVRAEHGRTACLLGRLPTLAEVAETAAFLAGDRAGAVTGAVINLTCGSLTDS